jgi:DNA-binding CsgD family transcriptional regulator
MKILTRLSDFLSRYQKVLEMIIILLFFSLISFEFSSKKGFRFFLRDYPSLTILAGLLLGLFTLVWIRIEKRKTQILVDDLRSELSGKTKETENKLAGLSPRQLEVFNLIRKGKSNKQIMQELNIELSTLKTHINQLYKVLGARNRKEAKQFEDQTTANA